MSKNANDINEINLDNLDLEDLDINESTTSTVEPVVEDNDKNEKSQLVNTAEDLDSIMKEANKPKKKNTKKSISTTKAAEAKKKYEGPRIVKVYGDELFTIDDPAISNEDIRQKLVSEYGYKEFKKDNTIYDLDEETGILDIAKRFEKKG